MKNIINGIFKENPTFVLMLGLCPALAITTKFENAYLLGICLLGVLFISNFIISIIKKIIPNNVRIPICILIIATSVTVVEMLLNAYVPAVYDILGIYLPLLTVNCIVLGRALDVASEKPVLTTITDSLGIGLGFTLALMLIALVREVLGTNMITIMDSVSELTRYKAVYQVLPNSNLLPISILVEPAGAFLVLGILMGIFKSFQKVGEKHESN